MENTQFQELVLQQLKMLITGQANLEQRLTNLEQGFTKLEQRQANLEEGFAKLEQRQANLEQGFIKLEQRQANLEEGFIKLEQRQANLEDRQARLEENQGQLAKKLDVIFVQTAMLTEFRTEVNEKLDSLQCTQDRQEKILERLSLRSIEHEADIAHIRMAR
ncbi:MAG: hypothetical protein PHC81_05665 [Clostridia bacterium]|nr:hypothetical protein [Clostridia bacterium]